MKKLLTISILAIMVVLMSITCVKAVDNDNLADSVYAIGSKYGMTSGDKLKMVRYLSDYPLSDADCNRVLALAQEADQIMIDNNTTDYKSLPADVKSQLKSLANEAADVAGVTLDFKSDRIDVYKDGKWINSAGTTSSTKLAYTGNSNIVLVVSSIAGIALVAVVARKKLANA